MAIYIDRRKGFFQSLKDFIKRYPKAISFWSIFFMFLFSIYLSWWTDYSERKITRVPTKITVVDKTRKDDYYFIKYKIEGKNKVFEREIESVLYNKVNPNPGKEIVANVSNIMIAPQEYEGKGWRHLFLAMFWTFFILLFLRGLSLGD